jgi:hypothetical protein
MLDIQTIPNSQDYLKIFYTQGPETWQTWYKPNKAAYVWIMCIGGGAGGFGGGVFGSAFNASGGGSGGLSKGLFPANVLPDTLYVNVGSGSLGAAGSSINAQLTSTAAGRSIVAIQPSFDSIGIVLASGAAPAIAASAESTFSIVVNSTVSGLMHHGILSNVGGQGGNVTTPFTVTMITGGAQGGSGTPATAGSTIAASAIGNYVTPAITGGSSGSPGTNGAHGIWNWNPMYGLGGAGGGGSTSGNGGNGGNGAFGCGGGGGGGAASGFTGGNGGKGGDGLVFIATF